MFVGKTDAFTFSPSAKKNDQEIVYVRQISPRIKHFLVIDQCKNTALIEKTECGWFHGKENIVLPKGHIQKIVQDQPQMLVVHSILSREKQCVFAVDSSST